MPTREVSLDSRAAVWRQQERFMAQGVDGLLHDKTRPARVARPADAVAKRFVVLTKGVFSLLPESPCGKNMSLRNPLLAGVHAIPIRFTRKFTNLWRKRPKDG